ncbi:ABC transporter ATP-binding protein [Halopenitus sp. POP-27]|uniref:ABC transporter ATP-binding protein n=1 Tax=Halopenitus sp. POP-27 TaxID=2994425 RepID=UPI002469936C|nr:ABC transporter ATP-binding protein [Halopenitus sp. POP-27]
MTAISAKNLRKTYGEVRALDGLSVAVDRGELYGFLGPNGAGKTTTMEILTGQLRPDAGHLEVLGTDPSMEPVATRERVGILPEQLSPPSFLTPREYFDFVGRVRDLDEPTVRDRVATWADRLGYAGTLDTLCADLSRGQQQKVMVTQAFLHEPAAVFIDEPLANLDPIVQERVKRALREYAAADNAVFVSTHNVEVAQDICTRVGIVSDGRIVAERAAEAFAEESLLDVFLDAVETADPADSAGQTATSDSDSVSSPPGGA